MSQTRRQFLRNAGLLSVAGTSAGGLSGFAFPPARRLANMIIEQAMKTAGASQPVNNYVAISLFAAPPRWMFDHVMKTKDSESISHNPMLLNRLTSVSGAYTNAEYATEKFGEVHMPAIWKSQVAKSGGGSRPMSDLLQHMIIMRGFGTGVDGHPANMVKQFNPLPGAGSISGHVADHSSKLIKAMQYPSYIGGQTAFNSPKGGGIAAIFHQGANANLLKSLLSAFDKRPELQVQEATRARHKEIVSSASDVLKRIATGRNPSAEALAVDKDSALSNLSKGLEDLDAAWGPLYNKYKTVIEATYKDRTVAGLSDQPIPSGSFTRFHESPYMLNASIGQMYLQPGFDLRDLVSTAVLGNMAQSFALAEFALVRGHASAIEIGSFEPQNLLGRFHSSTNELFSDGGTMRAFGIDFDQHQTGYMIGTYLNGCFYRALASALNEFVDSLKAAGVFKNTVIHTVSEFGRTMRESGGGSDHGFDAMVTNIITGMRQGNGPMVLGNILKNGTNDTFGANYSGTQGFKAPTELWGQREILSPMHIASSIGGLLNLNENVWINSAKPLFVRDGENIIPKSSGDIV